MASSWSQAYDGSNCPSGIFHVSDPREFPVHRRNVVNHMPPQQEGARQGPVPGSFTTMAFKQPEATPIEHHPQRVYLPALRVAAKVSIKAMVAETVVTQSFQNATDTAVERAGYTFPLYDGSVINRFKCFIGKNRVIEGVVEPKEKAKAEFEKAIDRQKVAALLEEHTPEIFETHIGSIPANETVKVEVSYISELKVDLLSKDVVFILPTSIAPRYGTAPDDYSGGNSAVEERGLEINVDVSLPTPITSLASRSHPISVTIGSTAPTSFQDMSAEMDPRKGNATLSNRSTKLESDFILLISPKECISNTRALSEPHPKYENHSAVMVTVSPQDFAGSANSTDCSKSEILFVIDCSCSMSDKVNDLRTAMKVAIRSLPEGCFFNMCLFGSSHELLWEESKPVTQKYSDEAFTRSARLAADMGGTEIHSALKRAVACRTPTLDTNIIVVTDGEVWDTKEIHAFVRQTNEGQGVRFFCLGIGNATSHALVEGIGRQGGGLSDVVAIAESGKWEARVIRMLKGALTPTSWRITLNPGPIVADLSNRYSCLQQGSSAIPNVRAPSCIQAPFHIPELHTFSRLSVFLLINDGAFEEAGRMIHITGESSNGETINRVLDLERLEPTPSVIHYLATHAAVKDLENGTSWLHDIQQEALHQTRHDEFQSIVKQEAESFGKAWSIVGKWTSFIAVEKSRHNALVRSLVQLYRPEALPLQPTSAPTRPALTNRSGSGDESQPQFSQQWSKGDETQWVSAGHSRVSNRLIHSSSPEKACRNRKTFIPLDHESCGRRKSSLSMPTISRKAKISAALLKLRPRWTWVNMDKKKHRNDIAKSPVQSNVSSSATESPDDANHTPVSDISVEGFMSAQLPAGCFALQQTSIDALLRAFDENVVQQVEAKLATISSGKTDEPLLPTILVLVYIEMQFQEQVELLELVINKAKRWLEKTLPGEQEIFGIARAGFLVSQ